MGILTGDNGSKQDHLDELILAFMSGLSEEVEIMLVKELIYLELFWFGSCKERKLYGVFLWHAHAMSQVDLNKIQ